MSSKLACTLCGVIASDHNGWVQHITGKKHQMKLNQVHAAQRNAGAPHGRREERKFTCTICSLELPDKSNYKSHMNGKKHLANVERATQQRECGVFVSGIAQEVSTDVVKHYFSTFGELVDFVRIAHKGIVLLQYKDKRTAQNVLQAPIFMYGKRLRLQPRRPSVPPPPRREKSQGPPTPPNIRLDHKDVKEMLLNGGNLETLVKMLEMPPGSDKKYEELCRDLEMAFSSSFPRCCAIPFGSTVTGLALKGSDIDVFLSVWGPGPESEARSQELLLPEELVLQGRKLLRKVSHKFTQVIAVAKAKIPIIKFIHIPTSISCDISFRNSRGVSNSRLILFIISLDPRIRPFLFVIKYWARLHELAGPSSMSNYSLVMMCLFYLQQLERPIIPSVAELQTPFTDSDLDDGWLCKFSMDRTRIKPTENSDSVFVLLHGFFRFYAEFDYGADVVCPLLGRTIPKSLFATPSELPDEQRLYKEKGTAVKFKFSSDMCVQDPFDLSHNLTGRVGAKALSLFCAYCESAAELFSDLVKKTDSEMIRGLVQLFDVNRKPSTRKYFLNSSTMTTTISVAQYLSVGYTLKGGDPLAVPIDGSRLRLVKIYKWHSLVYDILLSILEKVLKLTVKEESGESLCKVQKMGEPSDVHINASKPDGDGGFSTKVVYCESTYNVWDGRKKIKKALKLCSDIDIITAEETLSNALIEAKFKDRDVPPPELKFKCTFEPKIYPVQVNLIFHNKGTLPKNFICVMSYLQTRIPMLVDRSLAHLVKMQALKLNSDKTDAGETKTNAGETKTDAGETKTTAVETKTEPVEMKTESVQTKTEVFELKIEVVEDKMELVEPSSS